MKLELENLLNNAYAPYSKVQVAAILKTSKGNFKGVNIENSAYPSGICAERSAIFNAISNCGTNIKINEIHITSNLNKKLYPCAACLQVMTEFFNNETKIFIYGEGNDKAIHKLKDLLPYAVTKESFGWK